MTQRSSSSTGMFAALGRALDESMEMAMDLRDGKITRADFERWYDKRREQGREITVTMRDRGMDAAGKPVEMALDFGKSVLSMGLPRARARPRSRIVRRRARRGRGR